MLKSSHSSRFERYLQTLQSALYQQSAKLIVVLPSNHDVGRSDFRSYLVEIGRPDATRVLAKHLAKYLAEHNTAEGIEGAT